MGASGPFGRLFRTALGAMLGDETPAASRAQAALRRLERLGLADTAEGHWGLVDPGFVGWITSGDESVEDG